MFLLFFFVLQEKFAVKSPKEGIVRGHERRRSHGGRRVRELRSAYRRPPEKGTSNELLYGFDSAFVLPVASMIFRLDPCMYVTLPYFIR